MNKHFTPKITLFHCINAVNESAFTGLKKAGDFDIKFIEMACSSMVKDIFLMRAFEAGADAVIVLVCPEGQCRYVEGNIRAKKRVAWVKKLLDEIGIDGRRLSIFNSAPDNKAVLSDIFQTIVKDMEELGPNPAA